MKSLSKVWAAEPALISALVVAIIAAAAIPDVWAKVIMAAVALLGGAVTRSQVSPATPTPADPPPPSPTVQI